MGSGAGRKRLNDYEDNDEAAFEYMPGVYQDITTPVTVKRAVTKREVRQMFIKFIQTSPELKDLPREEQVRAFNLERQEAKLPKVDYEVLQDLLMPPG